jgi:MoaA/NifB/PqqE/SkfB family radical SAM enzyme
VPSGPTGTHRVLQLHPTLRCNLRCRHCYSSSGPELRDAAPESMLLGALDDAAAEGYTVAGFSGGEPVLYEPLPRLLARARRLGLTTTVTSNGTTLTRRRLDRVREHTSLLAISVDGVPESHNRIRCSPTAFDRLAAQLPAVRESGIPFGFIFTLTQHNLNELEWVAAFAAEQGARLLQIHPLEYAGRAIEDMPGEEPDAIETRFAVLELFRLSERYRGVLHVHLDIADTRELRDDPARVFAAAADDPDAGLAALLSPLVVEADGWLSPIQYGFPRRYGVGSLHEAGLAELVARWRTTVLPQFRDLCRSAHAELTGEAEPRFVNWYAEVAQRALRERSALPQPTEAL